MYSIIIHISFRDKYMRYEISIRDWKRAACFGNFNWSEENFDFLFYVNDLEWNIFVEFPARMIHLDYERRFAMPRLNDKRPRSRCYYLRLATKERRGERRLFEWGKVVQPRVQLHPAATRTQLDIGGRIKAEQSLESIRCSRCSHAL